eukprot:1380804-Amorphochlora_amoeboformis.AAC.1
MSFVTLVRDRYNAIDAPSAGVKVLQSVITAFDPNPESPFTSPSPVRPLPPLFFSELFRECDDGDSRLGREGEANGIATVEQRFRAFSV